MHARNPIPNQSGQTLGTGNRTQGDCPLRGISNPCRDGRGSSGALGWHRLDPGQTPAHMVLGRGASESVPYEGLFAGHPPRKGTPHLPTRTTVVNSGNSAQVGVVLANKAAPHIRASPRHPAGEGCQVAVPRLQGHPRHELLSRQSPAVGKSRLPVGGLCSESSTAPATFSRATCDECPKKEDDNFNDFLVSEHSLRSS